MMREDVQVDSTITLVVDTDSDLGARRVALSSRVGPLSRRVDAVRGTRGWTITRPGGAESRGGELEIADVVALRRPARASVLVPGADFARAELSSRTLGDGSVELVLESSLGTSTTRMMLDGDGLPIWWNSETGESGERIDGLVPEIVPAALLERASMPSRGRRTERLRVSGAVRPPPPSIATQSVTADGTDWVISFSRSDRVAIPEAVAALVHEVADAIEDDLGLPGLGASEALQMGRGDCTAHATALVAMARGRGYSAELATGYRRAGRRWLRHRWVVIELGDRRLFVDPTFAEPAPSRARLLALAIHGDAPDLIALADVIAFSGMSEASAAFE